MAAGLLAAAVLLVFPVAANAADLEWSPAVQVNSGGYLWDVDCPSATQCTALQETGS